jgi:hypothetical protein
LPQYHHFSSLALHKSQHPFKKDNAVLVDFSFRGGHIIVDFSFSFPFFWMYDMIAKLLQDNTTNNSVLFIFKYRLSQEFWSFDCDYEFGIKELGLLRLYKYWLHSFFVITCWLIRK